MKLGILYERGTNPPLSFRFCGSCLRLLPTCCSEMKVEHIVARRTHGNEANHLDVIEGWPVLECLHLCGPSVDMTLVCPSLRDLQIIVMSDLKTCKVVSPLLSKLRVVVCPRLDVSSMLQPSLEYVDVHDCNVSAMAMIFDFDVCRNCVFLVFFHYIPQ